MQKINIRRLYYQLRHKYLTLNNAVIVIACFIAISWAWGSITVMERNYTLERKLEAKKKELQLAELQAQTLQLENRYYQTDEYKELEVRKRLGLAYPGEKVLILPPNSTSASSIDTPVSSSNKIVIEKPMNFQQWLNFLFGGGGTDLKK
ncbi:MAG: FtsB family cell division protein [Candidatus Saccharimonadales bacterium]